MSKESDTFVVFYTERKSPLYKNGLSNLSSPTTLQSQSRNPHCDWEMNTKISNLERDELQNRTTSFSIIIDVRNKISLPNV